MRSYLALIHYPVYNKAKDTVSTCITPHDLHDIARAALTYGIKKYYVVNPHDLQIDFAKRLVDFWQGQQGADYNITRAEAFSLINLKKTIGDVVADITKIEKQKPVIVATSAKAKKFKRFDYIKKVIKKDERPHLLFLGTGWGLTREVLDSADYMLEPLYGAGEYNHLSVRSAAAIILDRLFAEKRKGAK